MTLALPVRRALRRAAAGTAAVLLLAGCGGATTAATEADKDTLTLAQPWDIATPDPVIDNGLYSVNVFHGLFDQLVAIDTSGALIPRLATDWQANETGSEWTFTVRDDAVFHDGTPVSTSDVVFSFQAILDNEKSLNRIYTNNIASMSSDEDSVVFTLKSPDAAFPRMAYYISIVPEAAYTTLGAEGFAQAPVGSGPYTFESWTPGVSVVLAANPDYWGGEPAVPNVIIEPVADSEARLNGLLSGSLDLVTLSPSQQSAVESSDYTLKEVVSNQLVYVGFNASSGPLASPELRKAISMAIDRKTIIDTVLAGLATPANGSSVAPDVFGHDPDLEPLPFDKDQAVKLVEASGYDGSTIPLEYATDANLPMPNELAQAIAGQLLEIGINVELRGSDNSSFNLAWNSKSLEGIYLQQFSPSMMDAATTLNYLYGPTGMALFQDDEINALITEAAATTDPAQRSEVISRIWQLNEERTYVANLHYSTTLVAMNAALEFEPRPDGHLDFPAASFK